MRTQHNHKYIHPKAHRAHGAYQQAAARGLALSVEGACEARRDWRHGNLATHHQTPAFHPNFNIVHHFGFCIMVFSSGFALCAAIAGAAALQIPLLSSNVQMPLGHPSGSKPLVNSTELQDLISGDRLMIRANKLYEIAKLGEEEYNHPTRVIGSAGRPAHAWR